VHDGSIVFNTKIDNSDVEKDLKDLEKKIRSSEDSISKNENAKLPLVKQAEQLGAKLDEAKRNLTYIRQEMTAVQAAMAPGSNPADYMAASADYERVKAALDAQEKEVQDLQREWDKVNGKVDVYDRKIEASRAEIQRSQMEVGRLRAKLGKGANSVSGCLDKAGKSANQFGRRIIGIGMSAFVFNVLSAGLRSAVQYMGKMLQTNKAYTAQLAKLRAALLAAFQPIYEFILPGLIAIMKVLTTILTLFGRFLAWLTGKDYSQMVKNSQALYQQASAIDAVGAAADKAAKSLAGFDEINQIGEGTGISSGGGSGSGGGTAPDFGDLVGETDDAEGLAFKAKALITALGGALAGLSIGKLLSQLLLGTKNLGFMLSTALALGGAFLELVSIWDIIENGMNSENLLGALLGGGALIAGATLIGKKLGDALLGGAIGALAAGGTLLAASIYDTLKNGLNSDNIIGLLFGNSALIAGAALLGQKFGNALLGGAIGAIVAGIGLLVVGVYDAVTNGLNELNALLIPFSTTLIGLGIGALFGPLGAGIGALIGLVVGLLTDFGIWLYQNWDLVTTKWKETQEKMSTWASEMISKVKSWWQDLCTSVKTWWSDLQARWRETVSKIQSDLQSGIAKLKSAWQEFCSMLKNKTADVKTAITSTFQSGVERIKSAWSSLSSWFSSTVFAPIQNMLSRLSSAISDVISAARNAWSSVTSWVGSRVSSSFGGFFANGGTLRSGWGIVGEAGPEIIQMVNGRAVITPLDIPYLAQGAVLPANKPFMAMVGDQKHGTNIEAPLTTIQEAVASVMGDQATAMMAGFETLAAQQREILGAILNIEIGDDVIGNAAARYNHRIAIRRGG